MSGFALGARLTPGSSYGLPGGRLIGATVAWRAVRVEWVLRGELAGYRDYAAKVRYWFVPHVW